MESSKASLAVFKIGGFGLIALILGSCYAILLSDDAQNVTRRYRLPDGRWSDDPAVQLQILQKQSAQQHTRWESDCRVGIHGNPVCP
jgi:hypothetical protein